MPIYEIVFYVFSLVMLAGAVMVITVRNSVYAALSLVLTFFSAAALWMLLEAEFLAIILILVYVGAVMVLFLFVVMMLDIDMAVMRAGFTRYLPLGLVIAALLVGQLVFVLKGSFSGEEFTHLQILGADYSNTKALGAVLYTDYVLAFELAAFILLVAMIAAISLTHRKRARKTKIVDPATQVVVRKEDRLKIVDLKSEKRVSS